MIKENINLNSVNKKYEKLLLKKKSLDTEYTKLLKDIIINLKYHVKLNKEYHLDKETYKACGVRLRVCDMSKESFDANFVNKTIYFQLKMNEYKELSVVLHYTNRSYSYYLGSYCESKENVIFNKEDFNLDHWLSILPILLIQFINKIIVFNL